MSCSPQPQSVNYPQEDDETLTSPQPKEHRPSSDFINSRFEFSNATVHPSRTHCAAGSSRSFTSDCSSNCCSIKSSHGLYQRPLGLPVGYSQPTPFPSRTEESLSTFSQRDSARHQLTLASHGSQDGCSALPSLVVSGDYSDYPSVRSYSWPQCESLPLPGSRSRSPTQGSLEQPRSLHSLPMPARHNHHLYPHPPHWMGCCPQCPMEVLRIDPIPHQGPSNLRAYVPSHTESQSPNGNRSLHRNCIHRDQTPANLRPQSAMAQLSTEQRKVFVTYETDNDKHVKEVITFVALLRHNGFYTHIDMFEQQYRSINKIDFMEHFISEKDYLIIIVISPKYYETVTNSTAYMEDDETLNTVYIHKQLQNEFIQNGCRNFRFIPILFPGARKCHVPRWLQNTHVYSWPRDCDDILRRLMRVEKYNPPPIGPLPHHRLCPHLAPPSGLEVWEAQLGTLTVAFSSADHSCVGQYQLR